jgi:anti-anti-sigma regulatory factor
MHVKIDTKEKFHEITLQEPVLAANMAAPMEEMLSGLLNEPPKNLIINLDNVSELSAEIADSLLNLQGRFYDNSVSFVICGLRPQIENQLDASGHLENMNITPTLSEAWDIVQMEEIERELLDGF